MTGEPLAPQLSATAAAQRAGHIGDAHVREIRKFFKKLPTAVDLFTRQHAEADLAHQATQLRPDQLATYAKALRYCLNPDGTYTDEDRARQRGITLGNQEFDGMSRISGTRPNKRSAATPAANHSATTMGCWPVCARYWPQGNWVNTTGYRHRSS